MAMYTYAVPILPGKTPTLRKYFREIQQSRWDELTRSRQRMGVHAMQAWLQQTPNGDFLAVWLDAESPVKFFDMILNSTEPFDIWFRDNIVDECLGFKPGATTPDQNELLLDFTPKGEDKEARVYVAAKKK